MFTKKILPILLVTLITGSAIYLQSSTDSERDALTHLLNEIVSLNDLIDRAEKESVSTERIRFRYDWLRRDLKLVRRGIEDHLDASTSYPRNFEPLQGDYRQ